MTDPSSPIAVRHYCPGGREHGGGIGRLVGYVADAAAGRGTRHAVCDTRGPRWSPSSLLRLGAAAGVMVWDRAIAPERVHHIHVAGRGSTLRKLLLCRVARAIGCRHVLHLHDYDYAADYARRPAWAKRAIQRMFQGADQVIVLGQRDWHLATSMLAVDPERVTLLQNCVPDPGPRTGNGLQSPDTPAETTRGDMRYRKLGSTGEEVSRHRPRRAPHRPAEGREGEHQDHPRRHRRRHHLHGQLLGLPRRRQRGPHGQGPARTATARRSS